MAGCLVCGSDKLFLTDWTRRDIGVCEGCGLAHFRLRRLARAVVGARDSLKIGDPLRKVLENALHDIEYKGREE